MSRRKNMAEKCVFEEKDCTNCGECDKCDLIPDKICDSCGKCLESDINYKIIKITKIIE
jgi:hypothetical protein